jgi:hypothetical protein
MGRGNELINSEEGVCPQITKTSPVDISLACSIGKSYRFTSLGIVSEVSGPESNLQCGSASVDRHVYALFRIITASAGYCFFDYCLECAIRHLMNLGDYKNSLVNA